MQRIGQRNSCFSLLLTPSTAEFMVLPKWVFCAWFCPPNRANHLQTCKFSARTTSILTIFYFQFFSWRMSKHAGGRMCVVFFNESHGQLQKASNGTGSLCTHNSYNYFFLFTEGYARLVWLYWFNKHVCAPTLSQAPFLGLHFLRESRLWSPTSVDSCFLTSCLNLTSHNKSSILSFHINRGFVPRLKM